MPSLPRSAPGRFLALAEPGAEIQDEVREDLNALGSQRQRIGDRQRGVILRTIINAMVVGSITDLMQMAVRDALIGFMAAIAQAQAEATKEAQPAGIAHAKAQVEASAYIGRKPSYCRAQFDSVVSMLGMGEAVPAVTEATGLSRGAIYRIRDGRAEAEPALARWKA